MKCFILMPFNNLHPTWYISVLSFYHKSVYVSLWGKECRLMWIIHKGEMKQNVCVGKSWIILWMRVRPNDLTSSGSGQISAVLIYRPSTKMNRLITLALRGFWNTTHKNNMTMIEQACLHVQQSNKQTAAALKTLCALSLRVLSECRPLLRSSEWLLGWRDEYMYYYYILLCMFY